LPLTLLPFDSPSLRHDEVSAVIGFDRLSTEPLVLGRIFNP